MTEKLHKELLFDQIKDILVKSRLTAFRQLNTIKVITNLLIGKIIVENEQAGELRAHYGKKTLKSLSDKLTKEFGRGFSVDNLELIRSFYINYQLVFFPDYSKSENLSRISASDLISETMSRISEQQPNLLKLSWSHFVLLVKMDIKERNFYEIESIENNWSIRELERQYNSSLFERLALSKDKEKVKQLSKNGQLLNNPSDLIKQPYILEFLGLKEEIAYSESDLERAIIDKIENFLLELGKGFLFEARQKRISFEGDDYYIDLVFYNRLLRCYVLVELKIGKLTHQDVGQMQMYVNYFDRIMKLPEENHSIGIILCKQSNKTVVEFTLPEKEKQIYAREYKLYLPAKDELRKQLESIEQCEE
jgi:predicted nuclease of restriction endonuclease-like (RecB) superfamily